MATQAGMVVLVLMVIRGREGECMQTVRMRAGAGGDDGGGRGAGGSGVGQEDGDPVSRCRGGC